MIRSTFVIAGAVGLFMAGTASAPAQLLGGVLESGGSLVNGTIESVGQTVDSIGDSVGDAVGGLTGGGNAASVGVSVPGAASVYVSVGGGGGVAISGDLLGGGGPEVGLPVGTGGIQLALPGGGSSAGGGGAPGGNGGLLGGLFGSGNATVPGNRPAGPGIGFTPNGNQPVILGGGGRRNLLPPGHSGGSRSFDGISSSRLRTILAALQNRAWTRLVDGRQLCLPQHGIANVSKWLRRSEHPQLHQLLGAFASDIALVRQLLNRCRSGHNRYVDVGRVIAIDVRPDGLLVVLTL